MRPGTRLNIVTCFSKGQVGAFAQTGQFSMPSFLQDILFV